MNENEIDNKGTDTDSNVEIIESELEETQVDEVEDFIEASVEELDENTNDESAVVVKKKGSFISTLAFLLSLGALALSGYLYYFYHLENVEAKATQAAWSQPINSLNTQLDQQKSINQDLKKQMAQLMSQNKALSKQFGEFSQKAPNIVSDSNTNHQIAEIQKQLAQLKLSNKQDSKADSKEATQMMEAYDDVALLKQIATLQKQLTQQTKGLKSLEKQVKGVNQAQAKSKQQLKTFIDNQQKNSGSTTPKSNLNFNYDLAMSSLLEAQISLNVKGNAKQTENLLAQTLLQLQALKQPEYKQFSNKLQKVAGELKAIKPIDTNTLYKTIDKVANLAYQLSFEEDKKAEQKTQSSWLDKIVTIRKVDDKANAKLTQSEKHAIKQTINNHFEMVKLALSSGNQAQWLQQLKSVKALVKKHYPKNSTDVLKHLKRLDNTKITVAYPDLTPYLNQLVKINHNLNAVE